MSGAQGRRCRAWRVTRADGAVLGFTDHDRDLEWEGCRFRAGTGLSAGQIELSTGLAVDNAVAAGALSDAAVTEGDIARGRFDGAGVELWELDWAAPEGRRLLFRGTFGEVTRAGGAFEVELRGLAEALNVPGGRVFQRTCPAVLGDRSCGVDLSAPGMSVEARVGAVAEGGRVLRFAEAPALPPRRLERGTLRVLDGAAEGVVAAIKEDRQDGDWREVALWFAPGAAPVAGDRVRLEVGCDKRIGTCAGAFGNAVNFRGFPDLPGEDWLVRRPVPA
ncbi:putative phage protein (TIGR02218 family) [Hasllibacter halocynthiae]|uniref:Putative phage protein (TIGR02218 family) n=1 Tax=Hasllibacter halocynthiae TaxID=595589 RepID=A0A2T0X8T5_9RHOB|nr:DUF2163 domain-containing protein [Hasllibacter halocynthiae]PRY95360.1 putative phage protein (TIGR02218 family) [Hasllibacter halocynthiae]